MRAAVVIAVVLALAASGCATLESVFGPGPAKVRGGVLVGAKDMTLYTFDRDVTGSGRSVCVGKCALLWPPFAAPADASARGDWTVVMRGKAKQWAYKGKPLYYWSKDQKPGDKAGDSVSRLWHVARP